ncbi:DHA2 family efflux MFS transporter permease subunit [Streptomyces sp. V4I2]|uniref:DHA2 family efflux MFS transporter permease subunit n=1 Tax=Streptomyces sp. V4I2 TaxID=3042280 RepID=UPI002781785A|nr:DHA2 family efflux MFS transporter permease subunit [Streptomyces sp. V4I2]MDQ1047517.1 EmrB/QacA subfamily drug resistance transporter [Streptomyces sp. V4I2]
MRPPSGETEPSGGTIAAADGPQEPVPGVPRHVWQVTAVVIVGAFITQLDAALVNVGLATVADDLHASLRSTQWIVSGYLLGLVVGLPLCGWGSRRLGAGRLWMWSLGGFTLTSMLCALATDIRLLVLFRILQGLFGGLLLPAGQTVIAQVAGRNLMGRVMSTAGAALVLGPAAGPVIGGLLIAHASWRWLFLVNIPVGLVGLWLGRRLIPRGEPTKAARFDAVGFVLVGAGLSAVTYAVSLSDASDGLTLTTFYGPLVLGCAALVAFGVLTRRTEAPLLNLDLFANKVFMAAAASSLLAGVVQFGALVIWALYFQLVRGYGVVDTGLAMIGFAVGAAVLPFAGKLTDRFGGGPVSLAGAVVTTLAFVPAALLPVDTSLFVLEACLLLLGVGNALSVVPSSTAAYVTVAPPRIPDAVTLINIFLRLGGAVGSALLVSVVSSGSGGATAVSNHRAAFWCLAFFSLASVVSALGVLLAARARENRC